MSQLVELDSPLGRMLVNPAYVTHVVPGDQKSSAPTCVVYINGGGVAGVAFTARGSLAELRRDLNRGAS